MKNKIIKRAIKEIDKKHYSLGFWFNLVVFLIVYKLWGFEILVIVAVADITRDLGTIIYGIYGMTNKEGKK